MSTELREYKRAVADQLDQLLDVLARIGLGDNYDLQIDLPDEDTPLADLFVATQLTADNLKLITDQLKEKTAQAERFADTVAAQSRAILELSTPVVQVLDDILILPLIGAIDTSRADQIVSQVLEGITRHRAAVVIVDITGVPVVDTAVAGHLMRTFLAARMLGAECVLTGVSPPMAQILVKAGIDVGELSTKGSLRSGLLYALERTDREICQRAPRD
jgi:rsbT co-antagonist protein RsbR